MNKQKKMGKMRRKILGSILLVASIVLLAAMVLQAAVLYRYYSDKAQDELYQEAAWLSRIYNNGGEVSIYEESAQRRLTLIAPDGRVLYDSRTDAAAMGNHLNRAEIQEAIQRGRGYAKRYSETLSEETLNVAVLLDSGEILRVSDTQMSMYSLLLNTAWSMILIAVLALLLAFLLAFRVARTVTKPLNELNLEHPDPRAIYEELTPLAQRITGQNQLIEGQMEDLRREHENKDTMRREFTANVSHELKTPLTSISGYAEIIKTGIAKEADVPRFAEKIYEESQRLITLVGDIIKLSQLDGKEIPVQIEDIDLFETCTAVLSQLELIAEEKNLVLTLDGEHLKIRGAEQIVEEIIFNICDNAVKYNVDGGRVDVRIMQCVDGVELSVSDTGIGIPQEDMDHIFERFYRVDKSHSKEIGGTGLGLSIVKHGVMFLGAKVSVQSTVGKGTTIRILF